MKKILFAVNAGKISSNENGGASVYYSHLEILFKAGFQIQLLVLEWSNALEYKEQDYKEIKTMVDTVFVFKPMSKPPKKGVKRIVNAIFSPEIFEYYFLNSHNKSYINKLVNDNCIDLVWSEWRWAGLLSWYSKLTVPVVYAHHDWEYKLAKLRSKKNLIGRFHTFQKKRVEFRLVKGVEACVSGSITEANEITNIAQKEAIYVPTTYKNIHNHLPVNNIPKIIHLGGMGTTANRLGLERFLDVCWKDLKKEHPLIKLYVIGSLKQSSSTLQEKLVDDNIECLGFVNNLSDVLHPEDIHIIPWEYNTGTRTRLPLALNYEQVLVATKEAVKAFPEIINNENAILSNSLEEMTNQLSDIIKNQEKRKEISKAGKETFFNKFTAKSQIDKMQFFLENI